MRSKRILFASSLKNVGAIALVVFLLLIPIAFSSMVSIRNIRPDSSTHAPSSNFSSLSSSKIMTSLKNYRGYSNQVTYSNTTTSTTTDSSTATPGTSIAIDGEAQQSINGFDSNDTSIIKYMTNQSIKFLVSHESPTGAILQAQGSSQVYTRDLSLAIIALVLANRTLDAFRGVEFLFGLRQGASYYTTSPANTKNSPDAWYQIYSPRGAVEERSLRGEDQGIALLAVATYYKATDNSSLISSNWAKIQNAANFIVYLQKTPGVGTPFQGAYRHGDNWEDLRTENLNTTTGKPIYWPYWPEYYAWEEENMRMIMGMKGAVMMASALGHSSDAKLWNDSLKVASAGIYNESMYNKYETYDYFGAVLWGLDENITSEDLVMNSIPTGIVTSYGVKDLPINEYAGTADTIDYMTSLVRVGNYSGASYYLHILNNTIQDPLSGGFYPSIDPGGFAQYASEDSFSASRFVFFETVALGINENLLI